MNTTTQNIEPNKTKLELRSRIVQAYETIFNFNNLYSCLEDVMKTYGLNVSDISRFTGMPQPSLWRKINSRYLSPEEFKLVFTSIQTNIEA